MGDIHDRYLALSESARATVNERAIDFAVGNGMLSVWRTVHQGDFPDVAHPPKRLVVHAPFAVVPSPVPRSAFNLVYTLSERTNTLIDVVSRDVEFLRETLAGSAETDEFVRRLLEIMEKVLADGIKQPLSLGLHRSDYMLHADAVNNTVIPLQVEINTVAAAFSGLGVVASRMHRFVCTTTGLLTSDEARDRLPENGSDVGFVDALATAATAYGVDGAVVAMIIEPTETLSWDQKRMEHILWERHSVRLIRVSMCDVHDRATLDKETHALSIDGDEIAVAYFRAGYMPHQYQSEKEWDGRCKIECSRAIKCPNVFYQLVGMKKIQQRLADEGVLERFISSASDVAEMRSVYAGLYSLDPDESPKIVPTALERPQDFVLKPQREGGGNNLYEQDLKSALETMTKEQLKAYILMQRIKPTPFNATLVRNELAVSGAVVSEFGVFSSFLGNGVEAPLENKAVGHLLRSKLAKDNDGGVAAGVAVLDSPYLVD